MSSMDWLSLGSLGVGFDRIEYEGAILLDVHFLTLIEDDLFLCTGEKLRPLVGIVLLATAATDTRTTIEVKDGISGCRAPLGFSSLLYLSSHHLLLTAGGYAPTSHTRPCH